MRYPSGIHNFVRRRFLKWMYHYYRPNVQGMRDPALFRTMDLALHLAFIHDEVVAPVMHPYDAISRTRAYCSEGKMMLIMRRAQKRISFVDCFIFFITLFAEFNLLACSATHKVLAKILLTLCVSVKGRKSKMATHIYN